MRHQRTADKRMPLTDNKRSYKSLLIRYGTIFQGLQELINQRYRPLRFEPQADHQRIRELHQSNSLFLCLKRAGLHGSVKPRVKPRMDFPDQFSKIFLAYQPFPSAPTRKFEAFMPSCPHCKHNKLTINHLYANGKNTCSHSYPHALTTFSRKISHSILFINHILYFL